MAPESVQKWIPKKIATRITVKGHRRTHAKSAGANPEPNESYIIIFMYSVPHSDMLSQDICQVASLIFI